MSGNLFAAFEAVAATASAKAFLRAGERTYSYSDLLAQSAKAANVLRAAGVNRGDRVLVQVEKSPTAVFLYLGCLRSEIGRAHV